MRLDRHFVQTIAMQPCPPEVDEPREEESLRPDPCPQPQVADMSGGDSSAGATSIDEDQHHHQHRPGGVEAPLGAVKRLIDEFMPYIQILEQAAYR